jgi:spermidine/putrescine transport system substrate-binding protein
MNNSRIFDKTGNKISDPKRRRFLEGSVAATAAVAFAGHADDKSLKLYTWPDYLGSDTIGEFTALTGISVSADSYDSSDEMLSTIDNGANQYDIVIASYDYIEELIGMDLLLPLDHSQIPNATNLFPVFRDASFDPGRQFSMPFLWGTQGICFRKSAMTEKPDSWRILFDSDEYSGRIALPGPDSLGLALKYLGYSYNSIVPDELEAAGDILIRTKPRVKSLFGYEGVELLANGEVDVAIGWSSEVVGLMEDNDDIGYVVPIEGSLLWQDCMCIPRSTSNASGAHTLINHSLRAEVSAAIAERYWYATPNRAALELLPDAYREDHVIFPGMEIIERCEPALNLGVAGTQLREGIWKKVLES